MGMHGLFIGTTGAGKSEGLITEIAAACLTHSPEVLNIVFTDFKLRSAAGAISRFPHVVAAVNNLYEERHLLGRLYDTLDGELDRRGEMLAALDDCPDVTTYNRRRLVDPTLPPIPVLWVITDEYNEVFADPIWGPKFRKLYLRIARVGRSLQVFLKLVGQTKDTQICGTSPSCSVTTSRRRAPARRRNPKPGSAMPGWRPPLGARKAPPICGWRCGRRVSFAISSPRPISSRQTKAREARRPAKGRHGVHSAAVHGRRKRGHRRPSSAGA